MPCYRVNWVVNEDELHQMQAWLKDKRTEASVIRTVAYKGPSRSDEGDCWYTKFVFATESGIRMFYRHWSDNYVETSSIEPWR